MTQQPKKPGPIIDMVIELSDKEIDALSKIAAADEITARALWQSSVPRALRDLLSADTLREGEANDDRGESR